MSKSTKLLCLAALTTLSLGVAQAQTKPAAKKPAAATSTPAATAAKPMPAPVAATGKATLVEKVSAQPGKIVIPYEKYVLPNGLTVIIHEDHSDPLLHFDVTYHVGSNREVVGKSGFAHFFEHMMFQGSEHVADEEHIKTVSASGGTMNGTTSEDRTNYFETLPKNQLEIAMWLESDRMGWLLPAVTQEKFEVQRATVKNERGQSYDNRPYGRVGEIIDANFYPYGHPYSWQPIGYIEDLNRVDVNDLKAFFMRWYGPNNATLTVGGDVNVADVLRLAEKYFGPIPKGPEVKDLPKLEFSIDKDRYISYEDNVRFPRIDMVWPTVSAHSPDEPALDALAEIIGGGSNAYLYQNLDKKELALGSGAAHPCMELSGKFMMIAQVKGGQSLAETEKIMRASLVEFETKGVTDEQLARFKAGFETQTINGLQTVAGKVSQLALAQTYFKNPNQIQTELDARLKVTKDDIMRVYNKYVKGKGCVIMSTLPKGSGNLKAAPDNYTIDKSKYVAPADEYKGLTYNKPATTFDRAIKPKPGANPSVIVPNFYKKTLANGIKVIGATNNELPMYDITIYLKGGHRLEADMTNRIGIANLWAAMMNESTKKFTKEEIENQELLLGSNISISSNNSSIVVSVSGLKKNIDKTLALLEERMTNPKFDQKEFDRVKSQVIEGIQNNATQPTVIASQNFARLLYGEKSILGIPASGDVETVQGLMLDDVKSFYSRFFNPANAEMVIVGDLTESEIMPKISFIEKWQPKSYTVPVPPAAPAVEKTTIYLIDKAGAPQSEIRVGYIALPYDATGDYYRAGLMNFTLGGQFNSRINLLLREEKGYTYGANTRFQGSDIAGPFAGGAGVKASTTDSSVYYFMKLINDYRKDGITKEELDFTKKSLSQSEALDYETLDDKANFLYQIQHYNLSKDYVKEQSTILDNITQNDINEIAKKRLPSDKMIILVVGNKAEILDGLKGLGYPIVELTKDGKPVEVKK